VELEEREFLPRSPYPDLPRPRSLWPNTIGVGYGFLAVLCVALAYKALWCIPLAIFTGIACLRLLRTSFVLGEDEVMVRNVLRSYRLSLKDIRQVKTRGGGFLLLYSSCPALLVTTGDQSRTVRCVALAQVSSGLEDMYDHVKIVEAATNESRDRA
jgi:hypothetical protein